MGDIAQYVALSQQIALNENTRAKLEVKKQDVRNARSNRGFKKRKVRNYRRKLRKRGARYDLVVQRLNDVIDNLLELDDWKVGNKKEAEAAVNLAAERGWDGEITFVPK